MKVFGNKSFVQYRLLLHGWKLEPESPVQWPQYLFPQWGSGGSIGKSWPDGISGGEDPEDVHRDVWGADKGCCWAYWE